MTKKNILKKAYGKTSPSTVSKSTVVDTSGFFKEMKLVFSALAWNKLMFFRHNKDEVEVSGQGISYTKNLLKIDDFWLIKQTCTSLHTKYDDTDWLLFLRDMKKKFNLIPRQVNGVWIHTHPGFGTNPSSTDEENWNKRIGPNEQRDFFVMCIVSDDEKNAYARVMMRDPVQVIMKIPVEVDWSSIKEIPKFDVKKLSKVYEEKVSKQTYNNKNSLAVWQNVPLLGNKSSYPYDFDDEDDEINGFSIEDAIEVFNRDPVLEEVAKEFQEVAKEFKAEQKVLEKRIYEAKNQQVANQATYIPQKEKKSFFRTVEFPKTEPVYQVCNVCKATYYKTAIKNGVCSFCQAKK